MVKGSIIGIQIKDLNDYLELLPGERSLIPLSKKLLYA